MYRYSFSRWVLGLSLTALFLLTQASRAGALEDLTNTEVANGLKEALMQGAGKAVDQIGKADGFLGAVGVSFLTAV